jgi:hypothetical protein
MEKMGQKEEPKDYSRLDQVIIKINGGYHYFPVTLKC